MGAVVSAIPAVLTVGRAVVGFVRSLRSDDVDENPTISEIGNNEQVRAAQAAAERAREDAERVAQAARDDAERTARETEDIIRRARATQRDAERAERLAREDSERATRAAREETQRAQAEAARAAKALSDQVKKSAKEMDDERQKTRAAQEEARRAEDNARAETQRLKRAAEEDIKHAQAVRDASAKAAKKAEEDAKNARAAQEEAERKLREGIQPVVMPTPKELAAAKARMQYKEGLFHFAIAGVAGGGKSSLINSFRGLRNLERGAAATGVIETTQKIGRFPDSNSQNPFVWYDIPGAGTLKIPDWQYFNAQGLYIFDCVIVLFDNRFTVTDVAILMNCARFNIPTYIVRSKSDVHIRNVMKEMGYDSEEEEEDRSRRNKLYKAAREHYIAETRASVKRNLEEANLPEKRVYIVTNDVLFTIVKEEKIPKKLIDELELMRDLFGEAHTRRCRKAQGSPPAL